MRRVTFHRLLMAAKLLLVAGLGGAIVSNLLVIIFGLKPWWVALVLPLPGIVGWLGLVIGPSLLTRQATPYLYTYRLLYSTPPGWTDERARQALLTLLKAGSGLDIIWARDGQDVACWLATAGHSGVLERLVRDVFPNGVLERSEPPVLGPGVVILGWRQEPPSPVELCQQAGIDGLYFRWRSETMALVVIWGSAAAEVGQQLAQPEEILPGQGATLLAPKFSGDNPWPALPPFPQTGVYPGLSAVSTLEKSAPSLRTTASSTLILGQDNEAQPIGFSLPELDGMQHLYITGQASETVIVNLVQQAVQANRPLLLLDGQGVVTTRLTRRLLREMATERVLLCDVERPGQSRFRLNPLWLPDDPRARLRALSTGWLAWLREQGVTAAGLGSAAFRHTQAAVMLTALVALERGLALDVAGLREALQAPDFLKLIDEKMWSGSGLLNDDIWAWWQTEGRLTSSFDMHLRLTHLRDRLGSLLELPEYSVLWRGPYLDPLSAVTAGKSLFWRLPDPRRRLSPYMASQLLALNTLLTTWPEEPSLLVVLHEIQGGPWVERLASFSNIRLVLSAAHPSPMPSSIPPTSLILSRLGDVPTWLQQALPGIRPTELKRLPPNRLVLKRGKALCTLDMKEQ